MREQDKGPYALVSAYGQIIASGLSYRKARQWAAHYGGSVIVRRYDARAFEEWAADILAAEGV